MRKKNLKLFPLKSAWKQGYPLSPHFFNIVLEFLARTIRQKEERKRIEIRKEEVKLSLFADDMTLHLRDLKTQKLLDIIDTFLK
jgi:hypothetical protein